MRISRFALAAMLAVAACTDAPETGVADQNVVTTDMTAYMSGQNVIVTFSGMQGTHSDWISLALTTDAPDTFEAWQYTDGATSGTLTFTAPDLAPGQVEARAYYDWNNTTSYTIQQRSAPFTVGAGGAMLSPSSPTYPFNATVTINYSGFSGSTTDWIAIYGPTAPDTQYTAWSYTGGGTSGSLNFSGLPPGTYEARYFSDWNGTHSYVHRAVSSQFTVGASPHITTDKTVYGQGETVQATYTNMPGNAMDYIAVSVAGSPPDQTVQRFYTNGQINGTQPFTGLAAGNYEARAYVNNSTTIVAMSTFSVTGTTVSTDATSYSTAQPVTVSWQGMPGNAFDYVAVSLVGSPDSSYVQFSYTMGQVNGSTMFNGLASGTYEARAYYNNGTVVQARSAPFTVGQSCTVPPTMPVLASLTSGDLTIDAASTENTASLTVPLGTSVLFTTVSESEPSPAFGGVMCTLHAADATHPDGITCQRKTAGTDTGSGVISIHWTVATFTSGVTVQRGTVDTNVNNPTTVTLSPAVDMASSFVLVGGEFGGGTGWGNNEFVKAQLVDASTLSVSNNIKGSTIAWQVVTMTGASVQRGTTMMASGSTSATVPVTLAPSGSIVLASYTADNGSSIAAAALMLQTTFADQSTVAFARAATGATLDISWEVVSLPFATQLGIASFAAAQSTATASVSNIAAATSVAIGSSQAILGQATGSSTYTGSMLDLVGEASATMVTGAGAVTLTRASSQASASIPWQVIDFAHNCAAQ